MLVADTPRWSTDELAYCSNVHAGETLDDVLAALARHVRSVRRVRGLEAMSSGLWLGAEAAQHLTSVPGAIGTFRERLGLCGIRLNTMNGFPYGAFHGERVKADVYRPDWSDERRAEYTARLARILAAVLPAGSTIGTISTLPVGDADVLSGSEVDGAARTLCRFARWLSELESDTGRTIVLCLEMEPGCVLEDTAACIRFFTDVLPATAAQAGVPAGVVARHIGVCYDVCHQAVMFEDAYDSLSAINDAGIRIGKIQLSSAVEVPYPDRPSCLNAIAAFDEPTYLHQVRKESDGGLDARRDLPEAMDAETGLGKDSPWRVHFHVPLQARTLAADRLSTTRGAIHGVLDFLAENEDVTPHLEVETYTWHVLPRSLRPRTSHDLHTGLAGELNWVRTHMIARGLLEDESP